jgi:integrase
LLRSAVDLPAGFVSVKTSKTWESVQIPIFPLLRSVLEKALAEPTGRAPYYVFPDLEAHYKINADHLTDRIKRVFRAAGFFDPDDNEVQIVVSRGALSADRENGLRRASLRDFHSFRVTWVTIALTAGVPMEVVKKVTGHRTADIVMKHYFQPSREEFRRTLAVKLPPLLGGRNELEKLTTGELCDRLSAMTPDAWWKTRDELLARLGAVPAAVIELSRQSALDDSRTVA